MSASTVPARLRIVIAGDPLPVWHAAAALAASLPAERRTITVVDHRADGATGSSADTTLPAPESFAPAVALPADKLVARGDATFTLGIALSGFRDARTTCFHGYGDAGAILDGAPFHQLAAELRRRGEELRLADCSLAALAAQAGRFLPPVDDARSILSTFRYGLHVDTRQLAATRRSAALAAGVSQLRGDIGELEHTADGSLRAVQTTEGERVPGDLFIDCGAGLAGPGGDWQDWSGSLPCDRVVSATVAASEPPVPYSLAAAMHAGWLRRVPLDGRSAVSLHYASAHLSDDAAFASLETFAGSRPDGATSAAMGHGRLREPWRRNCIALGRAAVVIDPLAASNLHLLNVSLNRLTGLLPGAVSSIPAMAAEYNRQLTAVCDQARDFAMLHYHLNGRHGEPFWDACRNLALSESLAYRLQLYAARGRLALADEEAFDESSWIGLLDAFGIQPRHPHPMAAALDTAALREHVRRIRAVMIEALRSMPAHHDYLARLR